MISWRSGSPLTEGRGQHVDERSTRAGPQGDSRFSWLLPLEGTRRCWRHTRISAEQKAEACIHVETAQAYWARRKQTMVQGDLPGARMTGQRCAAIAAGGRSFQVATDAGSGGQAAGDWDGSGDREV